MLSKLCSVSASLAAWRGGRRGTDGRAEQHKRTNVRNVRACVCVVRVCVCATANCVVAGMVVVASGMTYVMLH